MSDYYGSLLNFCEEEDDKMDADYNETDRDQTPIFPGSKIKTKQFGFIFTFMAHKMKLARNQRDNFYRFIKYLLPAESRIPASYKAIIKNTFKDSIKPVIMKSCTFCQKTLESNQCTNLDCKRPNDVPKGVKLSYDTIIFDAKIQVIEKLEKNWSEIQVYKGKL